MQYIALVKNGENTGNFDNNRGDDRKFVQYVSHNFRVAGHTAGMENKKQRKRTEEETFFADGEIVSATGMTGLISVYPADGEEADNYADILRYRPQAKKKRK